MQRISFTGEVCAEETVPFYLHPRTTALVAELNNALGRPQRPEGEFLVARTGDQKATWFFLPDKDLEYPEPTLEGQLEGDRLTVTAKTLVRDVVLFVDRLGPDAHVDDQLVTLLPGESTTFVLSGLDGVTVEDLLRPPVFNCANRFGRRQVADVTK